MARGAYQITGGTDHATEAWGGLSSVLGMAAFAAGALPENPTQIRSPFDAACHVVTGAARGCPRARAFMFATGERACAGNAQARATGEMLMAAQRALHASAGAAPLAITPFNFGKPALLGAKPVTLNRAAAPGFTTPRGGFPPPAPPPAPPAPRGVAPTPPAPRAMFPTPPPPIALAAFLFRPPAPGNAPVMSLARTPVPQAMGPLGPLPPFGGSPMPPDPGSFGGGPGTTPAGGAPPAFPPFDPGAPPDGGMSSAPPDTYAPQGDADYWGPPYDGQGPVTPEDDTGTWGEPSGDGYAYTNPDAVDDSAWTGPFPGGDGSTDAWGVPSGSGDPYMSPVASDPSAWANGYNSDGDNGYTAGVDPFVDCIARGQAFSRGQIRTPLDAAARVVAGARRGDPRALAFVSRTVGLAVRGSREHVATGRVLSRAATLLDRNAHTSKYFARARAMQSAAAGAHGPYGSGPTPGAYSRASYVAPTGYDENGRPMYGLTDNYGSLLYGMGDLS